VKQLASLLSEFMSKVYKMA